MAINKKDWESMTDEEFIKYIEDEYGNFVTTNRLEAEMNELFAPDYVENYSLDYNWTLYVDIKKKAKTERILNDLYNKYKDQHFKWKIWEEDKDNNLIGYYIELTGAPTGEDMAYELDAFLKYDMKQVKSENTIKGTHYELDNVGKEWAVWSKDSKRYVALGKKKDMKRKFDSLEKLKADLDLDLDSSIKQAPNPNDTILENTDYVGDVDHLSDERFNTLKDLFMSLYDNYILVPVTNSDTDFYRGIWLDDSGEYLVYRNYGQSADKATIENLAWIIDTIFEGVEFKKIKLTNENTKPKLNINVLEESTLQDLQRDRLKLNPTERVLLEFYLEQHPDKDLGKVLYQESEWNLFEAWGDEAIAKNDVTLWIDSYRLNQDHAIDQIQTVFGEPPLNYEEKYLDSPGLFIASFNVLPEDALDASTDIVEDSKIILDSNGINLDTVHIEHDKASHRLEIRIMTDKILWAVVDGPGAEPNPDTNIEPGQILENKDNMRENIDKPDINTEIRAWYLRTYPTDELGQEIDDIVTFGDIEDFLTHPGNWGGVDIYDVLGVADSVIRERVFQGISDITGMSYALIHDTWLDATWLDESVDKSLTESEVTRVKRLLLKIDKDKTLSDEEKFEQLEDLIFGNVVDFAGMPTSIVSMGIDLLNTYKPIEDEDTLEENIDKNLGTKPSYRRGDLVFHKDFGYGVVTVGAKRGSLTVNFSNKPLPREYIKRFEKPSNHPDNKWSTQDPVGIRVDMEDLRPVLGESSRPITKGDMRWNSRQSFWIGRDLVATADYVDGHYIFKDVTGTIIKKVKSDRIKLPKDKDKAWDKLRDTFGDKVVRENRDKPEIDEYYFLSPTHLQDLVDVHNWNYNSIMDELRQDIINYDIDITDGDLEGILMGFFLQNNKESKLYENNGEENNMNTKKKPITEALENLDENYVLRIEEDYDSNMLELFLLDDDTILAHGSNTRNTIYPWHDALVEFIRSRGKDYLDLLSEEDLLPYMDEIDEMVDNGEIDASDRHTALIELVDDELVFFDTTTLEELVRKLGFIITDTVGYSQGDHYAVVTEHGYDPDYLTDVVYNTNFYNFKLLRIGVGKLHYSEGYYYNHLDYFDSNFKQDVEDIVQEAFEVIPAYYDIDSRIYGSAIDKFEEALKELGLKDFDELED